MGRLSFGVDDEIGDACLPLTTDTAGHFAFETTPTAPGTGTVRFQLASETLEKSFTVAGTGGRFTVVLDLPWMPPLTVGKPVTIGGTALLNGLPAANTSIGLHDGIGQQSRMLTTDEKGHFTFTSTPREPRGALVEYLCDSQVVSTGYDVRSATGTSSPICRALRLENTTDTDFKLLITDPYGGRFERRLKAGETAEVLKSNDSILDFHVTGSGGAAVSLGLPLVGGGTISSTVNTDGVLTGRVTAGALGLLRFSVYGNSEKDGGVCWSPGIDAFGFSFGGDLCVGSDGLSVGGSATGGVVTGGFDIRLLKW